MPRIGHRPVVAFIAVSTLAGSLLSAGLASAEPRSVYTTLDLDSCETLSADPETGWAELRCAGYRAIPVYYSEADLRADVDFGVPDDTAESFSAFNRVGDTIEWRLDASDAPFATILRWFIADETGEDRGQVLTITKIGDERRPGCVVAYVDALANQDANFLARETADRAVPGFACGRDRAFYAGEIGPYGKGATATMPD